MVKQLAYLEKREVQLQYPVFEAEGWPLGSGMVESANKLVVEARLKGAGMHWAPEHVDPMVALRNAVCTDRWDEVWGQIEGELKRQVVTRRGERQKGAGAAQQGGQSGPEQKAAREGSAVSLSPEVIAQVRAEMQQPREVHPWRRAWSRRQQAVQAAAAQ